MLTSIEKKNWHPRTIQPTIQQTNQVYMGLKFLSCLHTHTHIYIYIYKYTLGSKLSKLVLLKTVGCFFYKIFKWRCLCLLAIFLMSGSRWWRKYPILTQVLSTILLVVIQGCVKLFAVVSFICLFGVFFLFPFKWWGWLIL